MVRPVDTKVIARNEGLKGFEPVKPAFAGKPEVSFEKDSKPAAPKVELAGNPLFAARGDMYRDMTPAQKGKFMSALEGCKAGVISAYGEQDGEKAFTAVEALLKEVIEFTGKAPA